MNGEAISPEIGYRLLGLGETVEDGDEFYQHEQWHCAAWVVGQHVAKTWRPIRRKEQSPSELLLHEADTLANTWCQEPAGERRNDLIYGYRAGFCYARNHPKP